MIQTSPCLPHLSLLVSYQRVQTWHRQDSSLWIPVCSNLLVPPRSVHVPLGCSSLSVLAQLWPVPIPDSSLMMSMVLRWPDQTLELILRLVVLCRHRPVQFHGCSRLLVTRSNLLDLFLESRWSHFQVWFLPVPFLELACWVYEALFRPVHCLPWLAACFVSSQPNPCLGLRLELLLCHRLVELFLVPNSRTPKVLARQSRVLVQVVRPHLNPVLFPCLELQLANLMLLARHPFLGSCPSSLWALLGVPSRVLPRKLLAWLALMVQPPQLKQEPSRLPV